MTKKTITGVGLGPPPPPAKPKPKLEATKALGIRLPTEMADDLDAICKEHHVNRSQLVRYVLAGFLEDYKAGRTTIPTRTVTVADI